MEHNSYEKLKKRNMKQRQEQNVKQNKKIILYYEISYIMQKFTAFYKVFGENIQICTSM